MNSKRVVILILGILFLFWMLCMMVVIMGLLLDAITSESMGYKTTECYDRDWNEIKGLECEEEIMCGIIQKQFNKKYCNSAEYIVPMEKSK